MSSIIFQLFGADRTTAYEENGKVAKNSMFVFKRMIAKTIFSAFLAVTCGVSAVHAGSGLFGSMEIPSKNMKSFEKWTDMWRRFNLPRNEVAPPLHNGPPCRGLARIQCGRDAWDEFIMQHTDDDPKALLDAVNSYMNKTPYIIDPVNWGIPDYWATPDEFFLKDGDCEDYAISKYVTLKRMGVPQESMRLVILQDENLRAAHAVLSVEIDGVFYILDNQIDNVLPDTQILHYRPVYSINETGWWLHRVKRFSS